ncbi:hypothetical protein C8N46_101697 [Kordia periserrulae]|uniref:Uncharacterized protein n=1 Tax=Kordia periserrulae TaxID=701523 RepID=A0A2T6C706_9FLAO|nr:hypothetical protein [Kordia periserrulae]PTX64087.1 hypothetical protein C8N46_101697 [Kordia periserrulae]
MSKKNINIVLILLVLFIWGSIGYTYFVKKETTQNIMPVTKKNVLTKYTMRKDTFELTNIKNPFKKVLVTPRIVTKKTTEKTVQSQRKVTAKAIWPSITYHGYVLSKGSSRKLGIINVNGKIMKKREKDIILETIKITKIFEDSIQFQFNNSTKTIKIK